jgi:SagB-type dehydrogenase family enzyme
MADLPPVPNSSAGVIKLPEPRQEGRTSVEAALRRRRSVREFKREALTLAEVSQLLWATQGITDPERKRTAPSAGALYPLEVLLVVGTPVGEGERPRKPKHLGKSGLARALALPGSDIEAVPGALPAGVYRYRPQGHELVCVADGDKRARLAAAALDQDWLTGAPVTIVIGAVYERAARKYGQRAERYVHMEVGHAAQNVHLQAIALDLGTVVVGAFDDAEVKRVLTLADNEETLCLMPVGRPHH